MSSQLTMKQRKVTPELAAKWLESNVNRRLRMGKVDRMARDMINGQWRETHQAIAFNCDGSLKDGQHRLHAVVKSGVPQVFWIATGLSEAAAMHIDTHAPRTDADAYKLQGMEVTTNIVSCAKQMYAGPCGTFTSGMLSREDLYVFIQKHHKALQFAADNQNVRYLCGAGLRSIIARAWYHVQIETLARFQKLVIFGVDDEYKAKESAAIKLRDWFLQNPHASHGQRNRVESAQRTQTALQAFLDGRKLTVVRPTTGNLFPLKTDKKESAA